MDEHEDAHKDESELEAHKGQDIRENLARREEATIRYYRGEISAEEMIRIEHASPLYDVSLAERLAGEMSRQSRRGNQPGPEPEGEA